jgi:hypothetical protein
VRESSGERRGKGRLAKSGDAELRRLLFLAARASLRSPTSPFRAQYERERAKGLAPTAAVCVVARKLARLCWSLWKHQTKYDPQRVYQQPAASGGREPAAAVPPGSGPAGDGPTMPTGPGPRGSEAATTVGEAGGQPSAAGLPS